MSLHVDNLPRINKMLPLAIAAILAGISVTANADACHGTVRGLYVDSGGNVVVNPSFRGDWVAVCNVAATYGGVVDTATCRSWVAVLTTLRVTQEQVVIYYDGSMACDSIPTYGAAPIPHYVMYYVPG